MAVVVDGCGNYLLDSRHKMSELRYLCEPFTSTREINPIVGFSVLFFCSAPLFGSQHEHCFPPILAFMETAISDLQFYVLSDISIAHCFIRDTLHAPPYIVPGKPCSFLHTVLHG